MKKEPTIFDAIWAAIEQFKAEDPRNTRHTALLLVDHDIERRLKSDKFVAGENVYNRPGGSSMTVFGIRIVESGDIQGWKLVKIESESETDAH